MDVSLLYGLSVPLDHLLDLVVLPQCLDHIPFFIGQLSHAVLPAVFEVAIVEICADHGGAIALSAVVAPLSIVVIPILPGVNALTLFFASLEVALILVTVLVLHHSLAVVFALEERSAICAVPFLYVNPLSAELIVLPVALVLIAIFVDHLALAALDSSFPLASVGSVAGLLYSFSAPIAIEEVSVVHRFADEWIFSLDGVFLALHDHFHAFAALEVILELADVDDVFGVAEFPASVILTLEEGSLIDVSILAGSTHQLPLSVHLPVEHLPVVIRPPRLRVNIHVLLRPLIEVLVLLPHEPPTLDQLLVAVYLDAGNRIEHLSDHVDREGGVDQFEMEQEFLVAAGSVLPDADDLIELQLMRVFQSEEVLLALTEVLHLVAEAGDGLRELELELLAELRDALLFSFGLLKHRLLIHVHLLLGLHWRVLLHSNRLYNSHEL